MARDYCTDLVPSLIPFLGNDTQAQDVACLIVRFTGPLITDMEYAKFRAQVMTLIHKHMSQGRGGVDVIQHRLNHSFVYNETHALWLLNDLHAWGFSTMPWFLLDGDTSCFVSVNWGVIGTHFGF